MRVGILEGKRDGCFRLVGVAVGFIAVENRDGRFDGEVGEMLGDLDNVRLGNSVGCCFVGV